MQSPVNNFIRKVKYLLRTQYKWTDEKIATLNKADYSNLGYLFNTGWSANKAAKHFNTVTEYAAELYQSRKN